MACGTGKTFTSLKIAEDIAGNGKKSAFLGTKPCFTFSKFD